MTAPLTLALKEARKTMELETNAPTHDLTLLRDRFEAERLVRTVSEEEAQRRWEDAGFEVQETARERRFPLTAEDVDFGGRRR